MVEKFMQFAVLLSRMQNLQFFVMQKHQINGRLIWIRWQRKEIEEYF